MSELAYTPQSMGYSRRQLLLAASLLGISALLPNQAYAEAKINGIDYIRLSEVGRLLGLKASWKVRDKIYALSGKFAELTFEIHKRDFMLNGIKVHLGWPVAALRGILAISRSDYDKAVRALLTPQQFKPAPSFKHLVIDAGHGGKDPGAQNKGLKLQEKNLTLDLAKRLENALSGRGLKITQTRTTDVFIELETRAARANQLGADYFISLHFNAAVPEVSGAETFAYTPLNQPSTGRSSLHPSDKVSAPANGQDTWNTLSAYYIQRELINGLRVPDRGVKRARFTVLKGLKCPGTLIEGGFVTHPTDGPNIGSAGYRERMAKAIAAGLIAYQNSLSRLR